MSEKQDLAILFSIIDKPIEEFVASESFKALEQEDEIIKRIEPFGLPEVKKLICCSNVLGNKDWTVNYVEARKLYSYLDKLDVLELLLRYNDSTLFEEEILKCVDPSVLSLIYNYFAGMAAKRDRQKKEKSALKGKITKAKKKNEEVNSENQSSSVVAEKTEEEISLENLEKEIAEKEQFLKVFEKHFSRTKFYLSKMNNIEEMDLQRNKAYAAIDEVKPPKEEEFLIQFIKDGIITEENEAELRNYGFLQRLLECFDKNSYKDIAFPVLSKLYSEGAIDLESELIENFVFHHNRLLVEYMEDQYVVNNQWLVDNENRLFIEYAVKGTLNGNNDYVTWWNSFNSPSDWKCVLEVSEELKIDSLAVIAAKLMHHVYGKSMDAFMELLNSDEAQNMKLTAAEFINEYLGQEAPEQRDLVRGYIRNVEQSSRKIQRKLANKEREINRHSQELFSSLYAPLEQLEELAVNLRLSDGEIKCSLVAGHVISALASLREGLAAMGLETAEDIETWQRQSLIDYNPEKHRMTSVVEKMDEKVKLQTMGYSYVDDEGNTKIRAAEVYIPAPVKENTTTERSNSSSNTGKQSHIKGNYPKGNHGKKKGNGYPRKGKNHNNS